jgi:carbon-monoxide dehydrogenase medium subunit
MARRHGDFAIVSAAVILALDPDGRIDHCAITLGGAAAIPLRMAEAEAMLAEGDPGPALFKRAAATARTIEALEDAQVPAWYRRQIAEPLMERALAAAHARATGRRALSP